MLVVLQLLLVRVGNAIYSLQWLFGHICPPESSAAIGDGCCLQQAGVGQVWPVAQVNHGANTVQADGGILRQTIDDFNLRSKAQHHVCVVLLVHQLVYSTGRQLGVC